MQGRLPEFGGGTVVGLAKGSAEMAVTGKAEVETQSRKIVTLRQKVQRPREP